MAQLNREEEWAALMRAAIDGDEASYRQLLESLSHSLRAATRRGFAQAGAALNDVEDVVQETLLAIHLKRHTWNSDQPLGPWVRAIARHKLIDALRRRGRRIGGADRGRCWTCWRPRSRAATSIVRMPRASSTTCAAGNSAIVRAISIEGQSIREVADRMGMNEGAVRVALHRGLKALAAMHREGRRRMKTDELIAALAADAKTTAMPIGRTLWLAFAGGLLVAALIFLRGRRPTDRSGRGPRRRRASSSSAC